MQLAQNILKTQNAACTVHFKNTKYVFKLRARVLEIQLIAQTSTFYFKDLVWCYTLQTFVFLSYVCFNSCLSLSLALFVNIYGHFVLVYIAKKP